MKQEAFCTFSGFEKGNKGTMMQGTSVSILGTLQSRWLALSITDITLPGVYEQNVRKKHNR